MCIKKEIKRLDKNNFRHLLELYELFKITDFEWRPPLSFNKCIDEHITEFLRGHQGKIITDQNGQIISVVTYYYYNNNNLHIDGIVTHPNYRNQGLTQMLYEHIEMLAKKRGCSAVSLVTWSSNKIQLHILKKRGYKMEMRDERYEGDVTVYIWKSM